MWRLHIVNVCCHILLAKGIVMIKLNDAAKEYMARLGMNDIVLDVIRFTS